MLWVPGAVQLIMLHAVLWLFIATSVDARLNLS